MVKGFWSQLTAFLGRRASLACSVELDGLRYQAMASSGFFRIAGSSGLTVRQGTDEIPEI
jgi:hypothetical protein